MELYKIIQQVRENKPLVQCITNFVTVNDCANILLAAGASPTMSMDIREVEESVEGVQALVCNLGAIEHFESMVLAGKRANALGKPVVLDPVAAGRTTLRYELSAKLLQEVHFSVIRGNASEIRGLISENNCGNRENVSVSVFGNKHRDGENISVSVFGNKHGNGEDVSVSVLRNTYGSGVDVSAADVITLENLSDSLKYIEMLAHQTKAVIAVSGVIDVVSDGTQTMLLHNGCETMARITGSGCMLTTLIGAFCGAVPKEPFWAAFAAMAVMGICGELAEQRRLKNRTGNATFRTDLIDAVFNLTEEQFKEKIRYEIYKK